jgi:hypothetical protein
LTRRPEDARVCGAIAYEAFKSIAEEHNFPPDFPSPENAVMVLSFLLANPGFYKVVAEHDGRVVAAIFLTSAIQSPASDRLPSTLRYNRAIGRRLMDAIMERAAARHFAGVRLDARSCLQRNPR